MKVAVVQPYYSFDSKDTDRCYRDLCALLDSCDDSMDVIVLPEYSDVPALQSDNDGYFDVVRKYNADILSRASNAAKRCNAIVFVNASCYVEAGKEGRNTTYAIDRQGNIVGRYFKAHPAPGEVKKGLDVDYSYDYSEPYVIEIEGVRYGFMTCYDFYFYESYAPLALKNVDVIIGCSHQRSDSHSALSIINKFLCYQTNAYLVRASISFGEESEICGCSCVIAPDGTELVNMKSHIGVATCEIDPHEQYYKPAGFGGPLKSHYEYIEQGRRPWLYRNGGSSMVRFDDVMPYPRLCAHRGFSKIAPENSMVAFGAAVSLGAEEIEFDIWPTADGEIVCCHDDTLDRVSNGTGKITERMLSYLEELDFGSKFGEDFEGLGVVRFEEVLRKFGGRVVMNVHIKTPDDRYDEGAMKKIVALVRQYECERYVYFMISRDGVIRQFREYAPNIAICAGHLKSHPWDIVDRAIELGCRKVQLFKPYFNQEMIDKAHANGIRCNVYFADDPDEARRYREMGIDTILTNNYLAIKNALK